MVNRFDKGENMLSNNANEGKEKKMAVNSENDTVSEFNRKVVTLILVHENFSNILTIISFILRKM